MITLQPIPPPLPANVKGSESSSCCMNCCAGVYRVGNYLCEIVAKVAIFILLGITTLFFLPSLSMTFFALAGSIALTRLVVKLVDGYNSSLLDCPKEAACRVSAKFPWIKLIVILFALIISPFSTIAGVAIASAIGIFNGILIGIEQSERIEAINREERDKAIEPMNEQRNAVIFS